MFLKCSDEKFLELFNYFMRFIENFCRFNDDTMEIVIIKLNERRTKILGYTSMYPNFYLYDAMRNGSIDQLQLMLQESKSNVQLMHDQFKIQFLESEIKLLKQYILKCYAKIGEDKTDNEVSTIRSQF